MCKSNFRAWLFAIALMSPWAAPGDVQAAGLGKLTVNSALGQPFKAEIDLVAVKKEEMSSLTVRLASRDTFRQANVDYASFLSSFKISVETRSNGQAYVKVTSSQPVTEPFLNMLVELNWSSGRLLREYTVLLDPPETGALKPVAPVVSAPVKAQPDTEKKPVSPIKDTVAEQKAVAPRAVAVPSDKPGATYGPVNRGDALVRIAREVVPQGVNLDQMLVALHRANRNAFSGNNMNRLKTGTILRVPDSSEIATISPAEASKEVKVQAADWNAYRQKLAGAAGAVPATDTPKQAAAGKITTTVQDKAAAGKEPPKEVLKLSKGEEPGGGVGGKDVKSMQDRIRSMEEDATAKSKVLKEANERVALLEKNIKEMRSLLEIKGATMAEAQKQASIEKPGAAPVPVAEPAKSSPLPLDGKPEKPEPMQPEAAKPETKETSAPAVEAAKPTAVNLPVTPPPVETSLIDDLMDNIEYVAGALALLLAGIAAAFVMRRKKLFAGESSVGVMAPVMAPQSLGEEVITATAGTGTAAQADAVDPVAEAEVYLSYGRDTQAEETLKEALAKDPARPEILAKLLEVHVLRKDKGAFEATALALHVVAPSGPLWERAIKLGVGIDPGNPLYGGAVAMDVDEVKGEASVLTPDFFLDAGTSEASPDVDFDLGGATITPVTEPEATLDIGMKFGAEDGVDDVETTMVTSQSAPVARTPSAVGGLEEALVPAASASTETPVAKSAPPDEDGGLALGIDFPSAPEPTSAHVSAPSSMPSPKPDLGSINFNMSGMLSSVPADTESAEKDAHWYEIATKFDLAKAYQEMGDNDGAKEILEEVIREGNAQQQEDAKVMLASL